MLLKIIKIMSSNYIIHTISLAFRITKFSQA